MNINELLKWLESKGTIVTLVYDGSSVCDYLFHFHHKKEDEWLVYNWEFKTENVRSIKITFAGVYIEVTSLIGEK